MSRIEQAEMSEARRAQARRRVQLIDERDRYREALERMARCERSEPSHAMPKDPGDRAWCLDCREWCYQDPSMACDGCIALAVLTEKGQG